MSGRRKRPRDCLPTAIAVQGRAASLKLDTEMKPSGRTRWAAATVFLTAATGLAWLLDSAGFGLPAALGRGLLLAALTVGSAGLASRTLSALRSADPDERRAARVLLALVLLALALRFVGLGFELTTHFHNDEGTFLAVAKDIQAGELLPKRFHYPHLLYYLSAFALWAEGLFPEAAGSVASSVFGIPAEHSSVLLLRVVSALLGALTTIPVFLAARRIGGLWAGGLAGALITLSPTYNEVSHLAISDVPAGFFAALALYFVARLLDGENLRDYLLAGCAAALAAASKYPAGVVAVAIVGVWLYWRWRRRDWNLLLLWSGAASVATLLAVMPALWLRFDSVLGGPGQHDLLFGYRQYALEGWIGVVVESTGAYYAKGLARAFGVPALVFGLAGLFALDSRARRRALALLPYPIVLLTLLMAMNVVVKRNMQPLLPAVAIVLGAGLSAWPALLRRRGAASYAAGLLSVLFVAAPAVRTVAWDVSRTRPGTGQLAVEWIDANIPQGAAFVKEAYTPDLNRRRYLWRQARYVARLTLPEIRDPQWDYLLLARNAHQRFLSEGKRLKPHHEIYAQRYEEIFGFELVERFQPGPLRSGPDLLLYRSDPEEIVLLDRRLFSAADARYFSDPALVPGEVEAPIRFTRRGQSVVFKEYLRAGRYNARINPQANGVEGWLFVVSRDNLEVGERSLDLGAEIDLPHSTKYFLRVFLAPGGELSELEIEPLGAVRTPSLD